MELSSRKRKILGLLVERYIKTAEPVSSGEIKTLYGEDISSATIRSELASLEELGYLVQPHVSAGRIPTEAAYKLYVENVLAGEKKEIRVAGVRDYLGKKIVEIEDVVRNTARVISDATNYTSVIVIKNTDDIRIREVKLVEVDAGKALVVIITDSGVIKDNIIEIPVNMGSGYVAAANSVVNDLFADKTLRDVKNASASIDDEMMQYHDIFDKIIKLLEEYASGRHNKVFVEGTSKMFQHPEFSEIDNARDFIRLLDEKDKLGELMTNDGDIELSVRIGKPDGLEGNCSMVTARYSIGGAEIGKAGVIGPERMDYDKVVSVLHYIQKVFNGEEAPDDDNNKEKKNGEIRTRE
ncbi:MAG: heat-inducible transcription repressor HrcA [Clostridia bacterium]|nr:heat-inducible transcription repressor HrcA [Clostridia bacterium]